MKGPIRARVQTLTETCDVSLLTQEELSAAEIAAQKQDPELLQECRGNCPNDIYSVLEDFTVRFEIKHGSPLRLS